MLQNCNKLRAIACNSAGWQGKPDPQKIPIRPPHPAPNFRRRHGELAEVERASGVGDMGREVKAASSRRIPKKEDCVQPRNGYLLYAFHPQVAPGLGSGQSPRWYHKLHLVPRKTKSFELFTGFLQVDAKGRRNFHPPVPGIGDFGSLRSHEPPHAILGRWGKTHVGVNEVVTEMPPAKKEGIYFSRG